MSGLQRHRPVGSPEVRLWETLVFKNIPEGEEVEGYKETKELLATTISKYCDNITYEHALHQIKCAHHESPCNVKS